jgi:predicted dehydrogenase
MSKMRIGLIGAGNIGKVHLDNFGKFPEECEIAAITDERNRWLSMLERRRKFF